MFVGTYLTGAFGQSQDLYNVRNEEKRGRGSQAAVEIKITEETLEIVQLQREADLEFIIDPMFKFFYLFQPLVEQVNGIGAGFQENWFNNNVFYKKPLISESLKLQTGFTEKYLHLKHFLTNDLPSERNHAKGTAMVILPSPYTLLERSEISTYTNKNEAITNLAELLYAEACHLVSLGIRRIQYDEPALVVKNSLGSLTEEDLRLLKRGMEICGRIDGATTSLHTYFGDAGSIIPFLNSLPVNCIGIDGTETSLAEILKHNYEGKELALGLVDARSISLEDPREIVFQLKKVAERTHPNKLWITPNAGTEYRGFTHGKRKLQLLKEIKVMLHE